MGAARPKQFLLLDGMPVLARTINRFAEALPGAPIVVVLPPFGACGFFGYYGHFLDLRRFERIRIYASEWRNFVEIADVYEERYYVSCREADEFVEQLARYIPIRPESLEDKAE